MFKVEILKIKWLCLIFVVNSVFVCIYIWFMCSFYIINDNFIYGIYFKRYKEKDNNLIIIYYIDLFKFL